ncbi:MAG: aspartate aminotransferase family protein [Alphaproteobacteria bacterium]|nr:aspartate aminotransferase family protein [Alphaproteobacteria bacterium]
MQTKLPERGRPRQDVFDQMRAMAAGDADWRHGRVPLYVFKAADEVTAVGRDAFFEFFNENALGAKRAFGSLKRMEDEVVAMALDLFHGPAGAVGNMTTGGSESIFMAVRACRDWNRARRQQPRHQGNMVLPFSAHPAFNKAAEVMDIEVRRVPLAADLRADPAAMAAAADDNTILLVGSAPCFPHGVIDPIAEIGELAQRLGVWLHVDACVGGYVAPFVRMIGYPIPDFDFAVPGVRSISADLHKFGFCPKPASTVFYRDPEQAKHQAFNIDTWPNGMFSTPTLTGTRPGGAVAAAWATMQYLGVAGYCEIARQLMTMRDAYIAGINDIPDLKVWGQPHVTIVTWGSGELDIFRVAEVMAGKGWVPGLVRKPPGMHQMMSMLHEPSRAAYLADLRAAVGVVRQEPRTQATIKATY